MKRGDTMVDVYGRVAAMAVVDGYVMCRRPRAVPFVMSVAEWARRARTPVEPCLTLDQVRELVAMGEDDDEVTT